jgi:hypothetical protein
MEPIRQLSDYRSLEDQQKKMIDGITGWLDEGFEIKNS